MKYDCDYRDCERWMCTNCATIQELCRHREVVTLGTLNKLKELQKKE